MPANNIALDVKDHSLILSDEIINDCRVVKIKNGTHLSDIFNSMPSGIICKDETGMGATTLELIAPRPSIIVEPLKITASTKANKHNAIYFGSKTVLEPKLTPNEIKEILFKTPCDKRKIVVVADSLKKLREILGEEFKEYFLLVDEADSFQLDSTFRHSMAICLDIYKEHPTEKRALVTATPLAFSDIDLQNETTIIIKFETPQVRNIQLIHTDNVRGRAIEVIRNTLEKHQGDKIMVAYNSVNGCLDIANHLVNIAYQPREDIKILCSTSSKKKVGLYFHELQNDILPGSVNLLTSAYFTGFDLHDYYHLICISDGDNPIFLLSDKRLKQVSGRCRRKLLSETIIYTTSKSTGIIPKAKDMIEAANWEKKALECISLNYSHNNHLKINLKKIRDSIIEITADMGAQFLRYDINCELAINYLSIDASIEDYRVCRELYRNKYQLQEALKDQGHKIILSDGNSYTDVIKNGVENIRKEEKINEIIKNITAKEVDELRIDLKDYSKGNLEREMIETYIEYIHYIEKADVIKILKARCDRDSRKFKNLLIAAYFLTLNNNNNFKIQVFRYLKMGCSFTQDTLLEKWKGIIAETGLAINAGSLTKTKVVHLTKLFLKTTKIRNAPKGDPIEIKIIGINPKKFTLLKQRKDPFEKQKLHAYFS